MPILATYAEAAVLTSRTSRQHCHLQISTYLLLLFLHLFHGFESSQRSLGFLTPLNSSWIRALGRSFSFIISAGFVLVTALLSGLLTNS